MIFIDSYLIEIRSCPTNNLRHRLRLTHLRRKLALDPPVRYIVSHVGQVATLLKVCPARRNNTEWGRGATFPRRAPVPRAGSYSRRPPALRDLRRTTFPRRRLQTRVRTSILAAACAAGSRRYDCGRVPPLGCGAVCHTPALH